MTITLAELLKDSAQFRIPFVDKETLLKIRDKIISSLALKKQSTTLLNVAKRTVEIAIEQEEQAALDFIDTRENNDAF